MSEEDLQLLITLDDPWNAQECDTFYNQEAEEWKGILRTGTALRLKDSLTDTGSAGAAPSARPEEDWFEAEREFRRGLIGPPERLPFSSLSMGHVTS